MNARRFAGLVLTLALVIGGSGAGNGSRAVASGSPRWICEIFPHDTPAETRKRRLEVFDSSTVIFTGKVIALDRVTARFQVQWLWKGEAAKEISMSTGLTSDLDWWVEDVFKFVEGREYLVFARRKSAGLTTDACSRTAPLEQASDEIRGLDEIAPHQIMK
jgi:hypothetical protein